MKILKSIVIIYLQFTLKLFIYFTNRSNNIGGPTSRTWRYNYSREITTSWEIITDKLRWLYHCRYLCTLIRYSFTEYEYVSWAVLLILLSLFDFYILINPYCRDLYTASSISNFIPIIVSIYGIYHTIESLLDYRIIIIILLRI